MRLLRDQVLVEPIEGDAIVRGIHVPERLRDKGATARGRVVSVGPRVTLVAAGDTVLFSAYCGVEAPVGLLLPEGDIFAIVEP